MENDTIGERIKLVRGRLGLNQKQLADELGSSHRALQSYERDEQIPGGKVLLAFSNHGIDINWLLSGVGQMQLIDKEKLREMDLDAHRMSREGIVSEDIQDLGDFDLCTIERGIMRNLIAGYLHFYGDEEGIETAENIIKMHDELFSYIKEKKSEGIDDKEIFKITLKMIGQKMRNKK
ncbi:helix-turn-helix domain-containing protein [Kiloniella litopenaei]|uniref:helix-turn-helix domain-containing protein n=1 Tax=Kiloniella litopenaei TaxID=1549748 RepID=UPI003BABD8CE